MEIPAPGAAPGGEAAGKPCCASCIFAKAAAVAAATGDDGVSGTGAEEGEGPGLAEGTTSFDGNAEPGCDTGFGAA